MFLFYAANRLISNNTCRGNVFQPSFCRLIFWGLLHYTKESWVVFFMVIFVINSVTLLQVTDQTVSEEAKWDIRFSTTLLMHSSAGPDSCLLQPSFMAHLRSVKLINDMIQHHGRSHAHQTFGLFV